MNQSPAAMTGGARALPSGERLAAAVLDFVVLLVPQVILGVVMMGHKFQRLATFMEAHSKDTHLATNHTYITLSSQANVVLSHFLYASEAITAIYLIGMYLGTGATLGKLAMGLRITRVDGSAITPRDAVLRSLVFWVPLLVPVIGVLLWLAEYIWGTLVILFRHDHRAPEDLLGRTMVVRKESQGRSLAEILNYASPLPPTQPPGPIPSRSGHLPGWGPSDEPPPPASARSRGGQ
ncbi:MAG: RDD family protein [Candidatus Dormibacteria bacterium]|jgi:uncharacterized RDD family membrane protein YckC